MFILKAIVTTSTQGWLKKNFLSFLLGVIWVDVFFKLVSGVFRDARWALAYVRLKR